MRNKTYLVITENSVRECVLIGEHYYHILNTGHVTHKDSPEIVKVRFAGVVDIVNPNHPLNLLSLIKEVNDAQAE